MKRRFRLGILLLPLASIFVLGLPVSAAEFPEISGSPRFVENVRRALALLSGRAPDDLAMVLRHVRRIEEGERSGMDVFAPVPCLTLGERTVSSTSTWLAGAIVHDATHAVQYFEHPGYRAGSVPDEAWTGAAAERKANRAQLDALRRIDAPAHERTYLEMQDGTHFDLDGDGRYTDADYAMRNW